MGRTLAVIPLGPNQLRYSPGPAIFAALTADHFGNAISSSDGFDDQLLTAAMATQDDDILIPSLDPDLLDAGFTPGEFAASTIDPVVFDSKVFQDAGDTLLADYDQGLEPSGGGNGGGGGGGGGGAGGGGGGGGGSKADCYKGKGVPCPDTDHCCPPDWICFQYFGTWQCAKPGGGDVCKGKAPRSVLCS